MNRRGFIRNSALGIATVSGGLFVGCKTGSKPSSTEGKAEPSVSFYAKQSKQVLFPSDVPSKVWAEFDAAGFTEPACGIVYRKTDDVPHGMPLGGVAAAALDLETDGTLGFCNLFNSGVPTRGPLHYGFLGLSAGHHTWILSTRSVTGLKSARDMR